jgi:hypothetical protein
LDSDVSSIQAEGIITGLKVSPGHPQFVARLIEQLDVEGNWWILRDVEPGDVPGKTLAPYLVQGLKRSCNAYEHCARLLKVIDPERARKEGVR